MSFKKKANAHERRTASFGSIIKMKLYDLIEGLAETTLENIEITDLTSDNREDFKKGAMFVCIKGNTFDGHSVARQMIEKGASCVVVQKDLGIENQIIVSDTREIYPALCANWFSNPQKKLRLIGVTGTNGKTTITTVIKKVLTELGVKVGLIGTCQNEIGDKILHTERTTPEPYDLYELLAQMAEEKCEFTVMEVSSQALEQKRVGPLHFDIALFTNLTQDHLDVHGTMENYYKAKKLLFSMCDKALINIDDESGKRYLKEIQCEKYSFSTTENADFKADDIRLSASGVEYSFSDGEARLPVRFNMPGHFNVSNSLAVIACLDKLGFETEKIIKLIDKTSGVRGRAEVVPTGRDFTVICDYAHTPDALVNILSAIKSCSSGRVVCLFGCGGNRDKRKRPLMARAAAENADFLVVTSDNPRDEDPEDIIKDVLTGLEGTDTPYITIADRIEAIHWAVKNAQKDDIIILAGKGHEDYQILPGGVKIHLDEREVVAEALKELK